MKATKSVAQRDAVVAVATGIGEQTMKTYWSAQGRDQFGSWAELENGGVVQRFRWINPGEFLMGSPEEEPCRELDEVQHEVVLTRGFWLADTDCTQALWKSFMGSNPSKFVSPTRPVEQVNWEDVQYFIRCLNDFILGSGFRLPTEAEWEYACRAGTTTPFSFGETITPEQVNYDGNYPYAVGSKVEYREQTVDVKSLPPNRWGLYEMHGNVLEWCADRYAPYSHGRAVDPRGPENGDNRVLRGGSWLAYARNVRAACRYRNTPDCRDSNLGFRLARGQASPAHDCVTYSTGAASTEVERSGAGWTLTDGELERTVKVLTELNGQLVAEAREYDARRREAMASCEAWRQRCFAAEARLRALGDEVDE